MTRTTQAIEEWKELVRSPEFVGEENRAFDEKHEKTIRYNLIAAEYPSLLINRVSESRQRTWNGAWWVGRNSAKTEERITVAMLAVFAMIGLYIVHCVLENKIKKLFEYLRF
jgi:hypothetical protein